MASRAVAGRDRPAEVVAGYLAAVALFAAAVALVYRPVRIAPAAMVVALVAVAVGGRHERLASLAVVAAGVCFVIGMVVAVVTERPLF
ncbi:MAG: hypothetical protein ICV64_11955 [Thermoleophilia bacterium]|nr:hypothetical protein [Thermoleophilia bacterium]